MTRTIQPLSWTINRKMEKKEAGENICDVLSLCESLNKLYETLIRLDCAIKKEIAETDLTKRSV